MPYRTNDDSLQARSLSPGNVRAAIKAWNAQVSNFSTRWLGTRIRRSVLKTLPWNESAQVMLEFDGSSLWCYVGHYNDGCMYDGDRRAERLSAAIANIDLITALVPALHDLEAKMEQTLVELGADSGIAELMRSNED